MQVCYLQKLSKSSAKDIQIEVDRNRSMAAEPGSKWLELYWGELPVSEEIGYLYYYPAWEREGESPIEIELKYGFGDPRNYIFDVAHNLNLPFCLYWKDKAGGPLYFPWSCSGDVIEALKYADQKLYEYYNHGGLMEQLLRNWGLGKLHTDDPDLIPSILKVVKRYLCPHGPSLR